MSNHPRHRRHIQVELLEGRTLLSATSVPSAERFLLVAPSTQSVNQQQGSFTVTLTLAQAEREGPGKVAEGQTAAALDQPVTVDFSASVESTSGAPASAANPIFAPFNESVLFPAGASTESVTVPIISTAAAPAPLLISLTATTTSPAIKFTTPIIGPAESLTGSTDAVELYSSPSAVPPTVTSIHLVTEGKLASAIVLGFSEPMEQATVENIHNYRILSRPASSHKHALTFTGFYDSQSVEFKSFPLTAAAYDPSTRTVTLTLKRPTKASSLYQVSSAYPLKGHALTDEQGQPLSPASSVDDGTFSIGVRGFTAQPVSWAPHSLKTTWGGTTSFITG